MIYLLNLDTLNIEHWLRPLFGMLSHFYGREAGLELREDIETVLEKIWLYRWNQ